MKIALQQAPRGIALMIVMIAVFVLTLLAGAFAYSMKVETRLAMNANREASDLWLGRSGVEYARYILAQGMRCPYTSLNQKWAGGLGGSWTYHSCRSKRATRWQADESAAQFHCRRGCPDRTQKSCRQS